MGTVEKLVPNETNLSIYVRSAMSNELKIDQSVSHNGVCLTVEKAGEGHHVVTAVSETLMRTNLDSVLVGDAINLERCMIMNGRIDGHLVQGHVDTTGICIAKKSIGGSWEYRFEFPMRYGHLVIEKGSVCINGISLTVFDVAESSFSVAIIPYTFYHTTMQFLELGIKVNIEFDVIGKYLARFRQLA